MRPITHTAAKQLLPVANRPILFYALDAISRAGITDIAIVISPETGQEVKAAVGDGARWGARITYLVQGQPLGLAHAVATGREFLKQDSFVMYLGDNLIKEDLGVLTQRFNENACDALIMVKEMPDPRRFGVVELDGQGRVVRLKEKPQSPKSNLALVGVYLFSSRIHPVIDKLKPSPRGEWEITDAIQGLIDEGAAVNCSILDGWWIDTGKKDDLLEANRLVLDEMTESIIDGQLDEKSRIVGRVKIGKGTRITNSAVRGPVVIGAEVEIEDSFIGPYTAIGDGTRISHAEIEHSIVRENCRIIEFYGRIDDSLLGVNVELSRSRQMPHAFRLMLGDDSKVEVAPS